LVDPNLIVDVKIELKDPDFVVVVKVDLLN
jgi:hypothetical protein